MSDAIEDGGIKSSNVYDMLPFLFVQAQYEQPKGCLLQEAAKPSLKSERNSSMRTCVLVFPPFVHTPNCANDMLQLGSLFSPIGQWQLETSR